MMLSDFDRPCASEVFSCTKPSDCSSLAASASTKSEWHDALSSSPVLTLPLIFEASLCISSGESTPRFSRISFCSSVRASETFGLSQAISSSLPDRNSLISLEILTEHQSWPHIAQKSVSTSMSSSWKARAVSGSKERSKCFCQLSAARAFVSSSSRSRVFGMPSAMSPACAAIL